MFMIHFFLVFNSTSYGVTLHYWLVACRMSLNLKFWIVTGVHNTIRHDFEEFISQINPKINHKCNIIKFQIKRVKKKGLIHNMNLLCVVLLLCSKSDINWLLIPVNLNQFISFPKQHPKPFKNPNKSLFNSSFLFRLFLVGMKLHKWWWLYIKSLIKHVTKYQF